MKMMSIMVAGTILLMVLVAMSVNQYKQNIEFKRLSFHNDRLEESHEYLLNYNGRLQETIDSLRVAFNTLNISNSNLTFSHNEWSDKKDREQQERVNRLEQLFEPTTISTDPDIVAPV